MHDIYVYNNTVENCYDAGITPQVNSTSVMYGDSDNVIFKNNYISNCVYPIEYFNSSSYDCTNIKFLNNYIENCRDITEGYRENSATSSIAQMCLWRSRGANDSIYIEDNVCIKSEKYALSFAENCAEKFHFKDNKFIISSNNAIRNPSYYSGNDDILQIPNEPTTADEFAKLAYYRTLGIEKISCK